MKRLKALLIMLAATGLAVTACDRVAESPMSVDARELAPQAGQQGVRWGLARAQFAQQGEYASAVISQNGGWLHVGDHYLEVRPGAVTQPTRFVMSTRDGENFVVDLHAFRPNGKPVSAFPANTVNLYMLYRDAEIPAGSQIGIGFVPPQAEITLETVVPQKVESFPSMMIVRTNLSHFSTYALIVD